MKKLAQGFNTAAQDSNPGSRSQESEALPLSHGALQVEVSSNIQSSGLLKAIYILLPECSIEHHFGFSGIIQLQLMREDYGQNGQSWTREITPQK